MRVCCNPGVSRRYHLRDTSKHMCIQALSKSTAVGNSTQVCCGSSTYCTQASLPLVLCDYSVLLSFTANRITTNSLRQTMNLRNLVYLYCFTPSLSLCLSIEADMPSYSLKWPYEGGRELRWHLQRLFREVI